MLGQKMCPELRLVSGYRREFGGCATAAGLHTAHCSPLTLQARVLVLKTRRLLTILIPGIHLELMSANHLTEFSISVLQLANHQFQLFMLSLYRLVFKFRQTPLAIASNKSLSDSTYSRQNFLPIHTHVDNLLCKVPMLQFIVRVSL